MTKEDMWAAMDEAIAEQARERVDAIERAMGLLGLDDDDDFAYDVLNELYGAAQHSGLDWEYSHPS